MNSQAVTQQHPPYRLEKLIAEARRLAVSYREATGQTLAVSAEIARYDAARILDLDLEEDKECGYDAVGRGGERAGQRYQIKGRVIFDEFKGGQRLGQIREQPDWDRLLVVIMDADYEVVEIHEAHREAVLEAIAEASKSRRTNRGSMTVARFRRISAQVFPLVTMDG